MMKRIIKINKTYKHFKGHIYKVICIAYDSESLDKMVVYQDMNNDNKIWVRPYDMFNSFVDKVKYPDINQKYRFEEVNR